MIRKHTDRDDRLNDQIERSSSSARSGKPEGDIRERSNDNRKGNIRDPDPNRPDPEGVPQTSP